MGSALSVLLHFAGLLLAALEEVINRHVVSLTAVSQALADGAHVALNGLWRAFGRMPSPKSYATPAGLPSRQAFDYIIVGGGTAGCVLASRLSENPRINVLVLEAGLSDGFHLLSQIPATFSHLFGSVVDWKFRTQPENALAGRTLIWPRGKMMGGCSSMNAQIYTRGTKGDYDRWAAAGCAGWSYNDILPYFIKSQTNEDLTMLDAYHGRKGPWNTASTRCQSPGMKQFIQAAVKAGIPKSADLNGVSALGVAPLQTFTKGGWRHSVHRGYMQDGNVYNRPNLVVGTGAHVMRIVSESADGVCRATAVEFRGPDGRIYHAHARKEVLLAAGAVQSPHLLQLSGIGPSSLLSMHNIPVVMSLPGVGCHLQDHFWVPLVWECKKPISYNTIDRNADLLKAAGLYMFTKARGMLTSNLAEGAAFLRTRVPLTPSTDPSSSPTTPHIEIIYSPADSRKHASERSNNHRHMISLGCVLLTPSSSGKIELVSSSPFDAPGIWANYLKNPRDVQIIVDGLKRCQDIVQAWKAGLWVQTVAGSEEGWELVSKEAALRAKVQGKQVLAGSDIIGDIHEGPSPGDAGLEAYCKEHMETLYHPTGTCKMALDADPMGVVDDQLRVRGFSNLRVADASIMPEIVAGHTCAPVVAIAEKCADMILNDQFVAPRR